MMRPSVKRQIWFAVPVLMFAVLAWLGIEVRHAIVAGYCEWGITCIIVSYTEENEGVPPASWSDLVGYEYHSPYLPFPRTIDHTSAHVVVDFQSLADFHAGRLGELPDDVIYPTSKMNARHINPKVMLEHYFRKGELPHGSYSRKVADEQRSYAEARVND